MMAGTEGEVRQVVDRQNTQVSLTHLQTPGNTERGNAIDVGTSKLDKVLDKNTPGKGS